MIELKGFSKIVYDLLRVNPTTKYIISRTNKSKSQVSVCLNRLVKKDYIKRVGYGIYEIKTIDISQKDNTISIINDEVEALKNIKIIERKIKKLDEDLKNIHITLEQLKNIYYK